MDVLELRCPADGRVQRVDLCDRWSSAEAHDSGTHAPTAAATQAVISLASVDAMTRCCRVAFCIGSKQSSEQTHREVAAPIAVTDRRCGQFFIDLKTLIAGEKMIAVRASFGGQFFMDRGHITTYAPRLG